MWARLRSFVTALARREQFEDGLSDEVRFHLDAYAADLIAKGVSRREAHRQARLQFGSVPRVQDECRQARGVRTIDDVWHDARYGFRQWRKDPAFALVSILSIALGIGATTAVFSVAYAVLVNPVPYEGADRMVVLRIHDRSRPPSALVLTGPEFLEIQQADVLDGAVAVAAWGMALTGDDLPEEVVAGQLSGNAFEFFGLPPFVGRFFDRADAPLRLDAEPRRVVVLSHRFWLVRYGGDPNVVGQTLRLDGEGYLVLGVAPPRFRPMTTDIYVPLRLQSDPGMFYGVMARLRPEMTPQASRAVLQPLLDRFASGMPRRFPEGFRLEIANRNQWVVDRHANTLALVLVAAALLLIVSCVNVSILLLARGLARRHEMALRAAIGASRRRLVAQLLAESLLLALTGGVMGVLFAYWGTPAALRWLPENYFLIEADIQVSQPVLAFSTLAALLNGLLFGFSPAVQLSRPQRWGFLRTKVQAMHGATSSTRVHHLLIAGQVALTVVLLVGAGATLRGFLTLYRTTLGYDPQNVLMVSVPLSEGAYPTWTERASFFDSVRRQISEAPGVESAALMFSPPPPLPPQRVPVQLTVRSAVSDHETLIQHVSAEYFSTLKIPMLRGRTWSVAEASSAARVAVINRAMADRFWPRGDPVGQRIRFPQLTATASWVVAAPESNGWLEIVGVAGNTPNNGLREPVSPAAYVPYSLFMTDAGMVLVRTPHDPFTMVRAMREHVHSVDTQQIATAALSVEDALREFGWARERFMAFLFLVFALLALTLAAIGLYSVVSHTVDQRYRELGIRMALGAGRSDVLFIILTSVGRAVMVGLAIGLTLTMVTDDVLARRVGISSRDPWVLVSITTMLIVVAALAAVLPARRATSMKPAQALRAE